MVIGSIWLDRLLRLVLDSWAFVKHQNKSGFLSPSIRFHFLTQNTHEHLGTGEVEAVCNTKCTR